MIKEEIEGICQILDGFGEIITALGYTHGKAELEESQDILRKEIAKMPIEDYGRWYCPHCGKENSLVQDRCPYCGQALDWTEQEG